MKCRVFMFEDEERLAMENHSNVSFEKVTPTRRKSPWEEGEGEEKLLKFQYESKLSTNKLQTITEMLPKGLTVSFRESRCFDVDVSSAASMFDYSLEQLPRDSSWASFSHIKSQNSMLLPMVNLSRVESLPSKSYWKTFQIKILWWSFSRSILKRPVSRQTSASATPQWMDFETKELSALWCQK